MLSIILYRSIIHVNDASNLGQELCQTKYGFNHQQVRFCKRNANIMPSIRYGANLALETCQTQFKSRHWNCTLFKDNHLIGDILDSGCL